jgi:hypothetical protein
LNCGKKSKNPLYKCLAVIVPTVVAKHTS